MDTATCANHRRGGYKSWWYNFKSASRLWYPFVNKYDSSTLCSPLIIRSLWSPLIFRSQYACFCIVSRCLVNQNFVNELHILVRSYNTLFLFTHNMFSFHHVLHACFCKTIWIVNYITCLSSFFPSQYSYNIHVFLLYNTNKQYMKFYKRGENFFSWWVFPCWIKLQI